MCCWPVSLTSCKWRGPHTCVPGRSTRPCKGSCFIQALVQWCNFAGNREMSWLKGPTALLKGWDVALFLVPNSAECFRGAPEEMQAWGQWECKWMALVWRQQLCFWWAGWEEEGVLRMGESEKQTHLLSPSNHALRVHSWEKRWKLLFEAKTERWKQGRRRKKALSPLRAILVQWSPTWSSYREFSGDKSHRP